MANLTKKLEGKVDPDYLISLIKEFKGGNELLALFERVRDQKSEIGGRVKEDESRSIIYELLAYFDFKFRKDEPVTHDYYIGVGIELRVKLNDVKFGELGDMIVPEKPYDIYKAFLFLETTPCKACLPFFSDSGSKSIRFTRKETSENSQEYGVKIEAELAKYAGLVFEEGVKMNLL